MVKINAEYWGKEWDYFWCKWITDEKWRAGNHILSFQKDIFKSISYMDDESILNKIVLEIGCGLGFRASEIAIGTKKYYGIDISNVAITLSKTLCPNNTDFRLIQSDKDLINLSKELKDGIDTVLVKDVFIHLGKEYVNLYLDFAYNVLKKNGILYADFYYGEGINNSLGIVPNNVEETGGECVFYKEEEIKDLFKNFDIIIKKSNNYPHSRYILKAQK